MPQTAEAFLEDAPDETKVLPSAEDFLNEGQSAEAFLEEGDKERVTRMASAMRHTLGVVGRAVDATKFALAGANADTLPSAPEAVATDEFGRPLDPRGRPPEQLNPAWEGTRLKEHEGLAPLLKPLLTLPRVTAQEVSDALSYLASASPDLTEEEAQAVIEHTTKAGNLEKIVAGAQRAVVSVPEAFTSPLGIATLGTGVLPAAAGRVVAGGFSVDMASHIPEQVKQLKAALASGDSERITEASGNLLATSAMVGVTAKHALTKPNPAAKVGAALMESVKKAEFVDPNLAALRQVAPLTAEATAKVNPEPTAELKPGDVLPDPLPPTTTPLTTAAVEAVKAKEPALDTPAPTPAVATGESGKPPVPAGVPPAKVEVPQSTPIAKPEGERALTTAIDPAKVATVEIPVERLMLSKDVPNFKGGASEATGTVTGQELAGKYERTGTAPVVAWERLNGDLEIITGRHRLDLARRTGEKTIPTQIVREADGFTKDMALTFDAEANIRDGQGEVADYATYFKNTTITEAEAGQRGLLSRAKGKAGWSLAKAATDDVFALWRDGKLTDAQAVAIANAAPGNGPAQQIGSRFALQGKSADFISNVIKASQAEAGQRTQALDLFGNDDAAMVQMAEQASRASREQSEIRKTISAISGAAKNPEIARREGVDLKDPAAVQARVNDLKTELVRWENWPLHPDLVAKVRGETFKLAEPESVEAQKARVASETAARTEREAKDKLAQKAAAPLTGGTGDLGQGDLLGAPTDLFAPKAPGINTGNLGELGMGGAKPGEFAPGQGNPTAMKYRKIDAERQERGLPPLTKGAAVSDQAVMDRAMAAIDADPSLPDRLVAELNKTPRAIEDWENHVLLLRKIDLKNAYERSARAAAREFEDGRLDEMAIANEQTADLSQKLTELETASRLSGSRRGAALRALRVMANEDMTLAAMEMRARADRGGAPISPEERGALQKLADDYKAKADKEEAARQTADARIATLEIEKALAEAKATLPYEPRVLQAAEKFAKFMDKKGEDALSRIKARLGRTSAGIDPTILSDVGILGAAKITRGAVDFAKWTDAMVRDLGEWFREHAQEGWDAAQKIFTAENDSFHKGVDKTTKEKIKKATDIPGRIAETTERIKTKTAASGEGSPIHSDVKKLVRLLVEADPRITRDGLIDAVHGILKESMPDITRLEAMDAISGRGRFWTPDQGEISKTVRDLSTQIRLVGHQMDVEAGRPLPRTGYQPEKLTDAARREQQKLNELKRRYGVVVTDPAAQLGSVLNARKTYYTHRIADLQAEISSRERIVKNRSASPTDPALEALKADYERVKAEHDTIFPRQPLTDAQRLERAIAAAERNETAANEQLKRAERGDFTKPAGTPLPESATLTEIRARTAALREETKLLKDLANPKRTPDQIALQTLKTRLTNRIADLKERTAKGDFSKRPRREIVPDAEVNRLQAEKEQVVQEYNRAREKKLWDDMTVLQKTGRTAANVYDAARLLMTTGEFSFILRQGKFNVLSHPIRSARAIPNAIRAMRSETKARAIDLEIFNHPEIAKAKADKLALTDDTATLNKQEEIIMGRWANVIPVISSFNRAARVFLNKIRFDTWLAMRRSVARGGEVTPEAGKAIAAYVNESTGRGSLGKGEPAAVVLSRMFFAPRYVASRFQYAVGHSLWKKSDPRTKAVIATEYARTLIGLGVYYSLLNFYFNMDETASIGTDPRSTDFAKLKKGETRLDPVAGLAQLATFGARTVSGQTKSAKGEVSAIRGKVPYGKDNWRDLASRFAWSKAHPVPGTIADMFSGTDLVGNLVTPEGEALDLASPLTYRDIYEALKAQDIEDGVAFALLALLGEGLQTHKPKKK